MLNLTYNQTIVGNGQLAVDALESNSFDVVFLDLQMPILDGEKTLQYIRTHIKGGDKQYCIALTATSYYTKRAQMLEVGFNDFLSKPLFLIELRNALAQVLKIERTLQAPLDLIAKEEVADFEISYLEDQFGDSALDILRQIAPVFLKHSYLELEQLQDAITAKEAASVRKLSHSLKGAVTSMGQLDLANLFEKLENEAEEINAIEHLDKIKTYMSKLNVSLTHFLAKT